MHYVLTHADNDPHVRMYPFYTYSEAVDKLALIHNRLLDEEFHYQRTEHKNKQRVRIYTKTGESTVYVSYQDE